MKTISIVLSLLLGLASLSVVVWIGRFEAKLPKAQESVAEAPKPATLEDLPMPATGPFGKAEVSETVFDFGGKSVGAKDEHVFILKNVGDGTLDFKLGKPTCQCTLGEITRENGDVTNEGPIAPGESVKILVKWVMKAPTEKFRQVVPIFTTDPDQRKIELAIVGVVGNLVRIIPEGVWQLGDMSSDEPYRSKGFLISMVLSDFQISEEPRDRARVKVTWEPADEKMMSGHGAKCGYQINTEVGTDIPIGLFHEIVRLKVRTTNGDEFVEFAVAGSRTGAIVIRGANGATFNPQTNRLFLGEFPADKGKRAKVNFIVRDFEEEAVLTSVEPSDTRVKISFPEKGTALGASKSYQADFEIPPGSPGKHHKDAAELLTLKFNHPQAPELKMYVDYEAK